MSKTDKKKKFLDFYEKFNYVNGIHTCVRDARMCHIVFSILKYVAQFDGIYETYLKQKKKQQQKQLKLLRKFDLPGRRAFILSIY